MDVGVPNAIEAVHNQHQNEQCLLCPFLSSFQLFLHAVRFVCMSSFLTYVYHLFHNSVSFSAVLLRLRRRRGSPKGPRPLRWPVLRIQGHVQLQAGRLLRQWRSLRRPAVQGGGIRGVRLRRYQLRGYALRIRQGIHAARVGHHKVWSEVKRHGLRHEERW